MKRLARTGENSWQHHLFGHKMYPEKENMFLMLQIQKAFFNSNLVMFKGRKDKLFL